MQKMNEGEFKKHIWNLLSLDNRPVEFSKEQFDVLNNVLMGMIDEARKEFPDENDGKFDTWENDDEWNIFNPNDYIEAVKEWRLKYLGEQK